MESVHNAPLEAVLDAVLDSWDRNNDILLGLLRVLPGDALKVRAAMDSPSVGQMFHHMHFVRLVFLEEDAPEFAQALPDAEWSDTSNAAQLERMLGESAAAVREAVRAKLVSGGEMAMHYDHPVLFLQHMIWHEGYHQGQIKLALKLAGCPVNDEVAGPVTWDVWMRKSAAP
jgi:uncharacterized damage-inducible protein DinB